MMWDVVCNINYILSCSKISYIDVYERIIEKKKQGALNRILIFFKITALSLVDRKGEKINRCESASAIYFFSTSNQKKVYERLFDNDSKAEVEIVGLNINSSDNKCISLKIVALINLFYFPLVLSLFLMKLYGVEKSRYRLLARLCLERFLITPGYYLYFRYVFGFCGYQIVITSNDHTPANRGLVLACKHRGIKTVYLQHAAVAEHFPPLEVFDVAILDGQHSLDIYKKIGPLSKKVFIVGHGFYKKATWNQQFKVGIAINQLIDTPKLKLLILDLVNAGVNKIEIRPHPMQSIYSLQSIRNLLDSLEYRRVDLQLNPKGESLLFFSQRNNLVIAGNSSVHLDLLRYGSATMSADLDTLDVSDYYSFVSSGVTNEFDLAFMNRLIEKEIFFSDYFSLQLNNATYYDNAILDGSIMQANKVQFDLILRLLTCLDDKKEFKKIRFDLGLWESIY